MGIEDFLKIKLNDCIVIVNAENGNVIVVDKELFNDKKTFIKKLKKNSYFEELVYSMNFDKDSFKAVYISLHISSKCNMNCKYCFMKNRKDNYLSYEDSRRFIDMIIDEYPNAGKYIVDPTGSGEPLLQLDNLCKIGEYCKQRSDELKREVLPMIVTNGLLLTEKTVERLRESGILFGVSLDGDRKTNDTYRYDYLKNGTYKRVLGNIKRIKDRSFMGVALTITDKNMDLVKNLKHLVKYFPTVSMKPVRAINSNMGINESNIDEIKKSYTELYDFLLKQTKMGNLEYLSAILNGDDYFGKFLLRSILGIKVTTRCDAGIGRFSLAPDGTIYACPGAIDIPELVVGSLDKGIDKEKRKFLWNTLVNRNKCQDCFAKFVCGGECFVNAYYSTKSIIGKDDIMCELKRHLFRLSLTFNHYIKQMKCYGVVVRGCVEKTRRLDEDKVVTDFLKSNPNVSFNDIKYHKVNINCK
jgi:uncharacterized protein